MIVILVTLLVTINLSAQVPAERVPAFKFFKFNKTAFTDKDLPENKLLFFIFFDPTCEHCKMAIQKINKYYSECKQTAIFLIAIESEESIRSFLNSYGPNLINKKNVLILRDPQNEFIGKFKPRKYPSIFLYSKKRKLLLYEDNEEKMYEFFKLINSPNG